MKDFKIIDKVLGYRSAPDPTNEDPHYLIAGSQNVLIDRQLKVHSRQGYSRLGAANSATTPIRKGLTWNSSTGLELPIRQYDDELEVYLGTVDGYDVDAWTRIINGLSTTEIFRGDLWWDATENLDLLLGVMGDDNIYEWNGAVAVVDSITGTTITKKGTATFAQNRFYTTRNKTLICARTGTEYTYTGGESTTTLTGIADTTGLVAGDVLVQKMITTADKPAANRTNDTILVFENQLVLGSFDDNEVYISQNDDYDDFSHSSPRIAGEGELLTLDGPSGGFGILSDNLIAFAGKSSIFKTKYTEITVGTTLTEILAVKKMKSGINQSSQAPDCIVPIGDSLAYLSYEPALRMLEQPEDISSPQLKTLSNPIKPDFDAETWTNAQGLWDKNSFYISAPSTSKLYILEFIEDSDGNTRRFWQPPQILPVRSLVIIDGDLYGHSNSVAETYKLFDGYSDINSSDEKLPIEAIAMFAYNDYGKRALLKNFDEYNVEGYISPSTKDLLMTIDYDFGGFTQSIEKTIDGTDEDILEDFVDGISLGQASLGQEPLGGSSSVPSDSRKFGVYFEVAKEDFYRIRVKFSTNEVDRYWSILSHGANVLLSRRRNTLNHK